jgi:hypothetical protein
VLAGVIVSLIGQGLSPFDAATLGVYLHGRAGAERSADLGDAGLMATDLLTAIPRVRAVRDGDVVSGARRQTPISPWCATMSAVRLLAAPGRGARVKPTPTARRPPRRGPRRHRRRPLSRPGRGAVPTCRISAGALFYPVPRRPRVEAVAAGVNSPSPLAATTPGRVVVGRRSPAAGWRPASAAGLSVETSSARAPWSGSPPAPGKLWSHPPARPSLTPSPTGGSSRVAASARQASACRASASPRRRSLAVRPAGR